MAGRRTKVEYIRKPGLFERLGKSISGIIIGFGMFLCSFVILYYNEGWSVETSIMLNEGLAEVVSLDISSTYAFNEKLVHHVGFLQTEEEIIDPLFGLHLKCIHLHRKVEMYQWVEYSDVKEFKDGDEIRRETTYSYSTEWRGPHISSRNFDEEVGHRNPADKLIEDAKFSVPAVAVDGLYLSNSMINRINWYKTVNSLPPPEEVQGALQHLQYYYIGKDPRLPEVGDTRVHFDCAGVPQGSIIGPPDTVSIIAKFENGKFSPFTTTNGKAIEFLQQGSKSIQEIFDSASSFNSFRTGILRVFGTVLMFFGLSIMSRVIVTLVDWIPIVREIVAFSVGMFNVTLALSLSSLTIAFSWIRFHPLFASGVFALACLPWYICRQRAKSYLSR